MEEEYKKKEEGTDRYEPRQYQPPYISPMEAVTHEAYGGGLYGKDEEKETKNKEKEPPQQHKPPESESQSADGPAGEGKTTVKKQLPISSDRDVEITGISYIQ